MKPNAIYACGAAAVTLVLTVPAFADDYYYHPGQSSESYYDIPPLQMQIEGGGAVTTGQTGKFFDNGWTAGAGIIWHPEPGPLALRTMLDFTRLGATQQAIQDAESETQMEIDNGFADVASLHINGMYEWPIAPFTRAYLTAGGGGSWERVEFTQRYPFEGYFCDWWVCGTSYRVGQLVVSRNQTTRLSWDAGVGLDFSTGGYQSWFIEATFEKVDTPQPTTFVPITIGIRF